jgi:hypothetical protein
LSILLVPKGVEEVIRREEGLYILRCGIRIGKFGYGCCAIRWMGLGFDGFDDTLLV